MRTNNDQYWATLQDLEFIDEALGKVDSYHSYLEDSGIYWVLIRCYVAYYGANLSSKEIGQIFSGAKLDVNNKVIKLKMNHYRNVLKHALQLTTSQRPAVSCRSTNTDLKSQTQTILGAGLLDFYIREKSYGEIFTRATEYGLALLEGWVHSPWRKDIGDVYDFDIDNNKTVYQGDVDPKVHSMLSIIRDVEIEHDKHQWLMVEEFENRWDLAAEYGSADEELYSKIINANTDRKGSTSTRVERFNQYLSNRTTLEKKDQVKVYTFYHNKSPAMPNGRIVKFIDGAILQDKAMPYRRMPLNCIKPDSILESPFGYSPAVEILGAQQAIDVLGTAIMTNNGTNGIQKIWTQSGDNMSVTDIGDTLVHLQSKTKPEGINMTATAPETFNFLNKLEGTIETLSGISSTVRGNPEANLKSGAALALVVSQSIQFASLFEQSYNKLIENEGTDLIDKLRLFAKTPRVAAIMGEASRPYQKQFTADDLSEINRVVVEQANALSKTVAGRVQLADTLLEKGMIENAKQYLAVVNTGQLDPATENPQFRLLNIRAENEEMRNGKDVQAVMTENHADHIKEHSILIENPDAKQDPELTSRVLDHIQEHLDLWRSADPAILMITGQQPPPPPLAPPVPQPEQQASGGESPAGLMNRQNGGAVPPDAMPAQPSMPRNPLTNEEFNNNTGGM